MIKGNFQDLGGRQIHQDDLYILQAELYKAIELQYAGFGAFINQGCIVTGTMGNYSISGGLVFINGQVMEFSAVSGITSFPKYIVQAANVNQDSFTLEQGGSAYKRTLIKAALSDTAPVSGEFITMSAGGGKNYNDILAAQFVRLSGNQTVNGQKTFTSDVISNGINLNNALSTLNSDLSNKANKSITITGAGSLGGGGDLSANRSITLNDGGVSTVKLADGSVSNAKLGTDLIKVLTTPVVETVSGSLNPTFSTSNLPGCKLGFWVIIAWANAAPNVGVLSYRINGVGIDGQNILRLTQTHYHSGSSISGSHEMSLFVPLPQSRTGTFSMGHYVGSGVSASLRVYMYI